MQPGLTPIASLLQNADFTEILIDGWQKVYVETRGTLQDVPTPFTQESAVYDLIDAILAPLGRKADESHPIHNVRLPDGALVNIVVPPIARTGPTVTIRKLMDRDQLNIEKLITFGSANQAMFDFLRACVLSRLNIVVAGGTASGKTTILHILCRWIPDHERIVVVQTADDFRLIQPRVVVLETRPANLTGRGEITAQQLITNATNMRPDRIVLIEAHGGELFTMLNALSTGYDGGLFSLHATSVRDALARMEVLASYANPALPLLSLREQIVSGVDIILSQERLADGGRRIMKIAEVTGMQDGVVATQDLFEFRRTGIRNNKIEGVFTATGAIPRTLEKLQYASSAYGLELPVSLFTPA